MTIRDLLGEDGDYDDLPENVRRRLIAASEKRENEIAHIEGEEPESDSLPPQIIYDTDGGSAVTPSAEYINRLIHVGVPKKPIGDKAEKLWVFSPEFLEQVVLNNLDAKSQAKLWRRWVDIDSQSQGDGNDELVQSRQRAFALRVISQRARSDLPDVGTRERMALVTSEARQRVSQNITTVQGKSPNSVGGFLSRLFGK